MLGASCLVAAACGPGSAGGSPTTAAPRASTSTTPTGARAATTTAPSETEQLTVDPFTSAGIVPGITIAFRTTGTCATQSLLDPSRGGAYACTLDHAERSGAKSADPCFYDAFGEQSSPLLCFTSPLDLSVVEVSPDNLLPSPGSLSGDPWALKLADGQVCTYLGATPAATSGPAPALDYRCPYGGIQGGPDTSAAFWTARYVPGGTSAAQTVQVDAAYT